MKKVLNICFYMLCCLVFLSACGKPSAESNQSVSQQDEMHIPTSAAEPVQPSHEALAEEYINKLSLEEKVAQLFFARCPAENGAALAEQYNIGGYILFGRDFEGQTPDSISQTIASYQESAQTPMLIGVDEEGGTVVRVSANSNFRESKFQSPQTLYAEGGFDRIIGDTKEKDALLSSIGINVNLAPVCDVSTNSSDFINARAFGQDAENTSEFVKTVVTQMNSDGIGMVLKHFPGYGNNVDTHTGIAIDNRPFSEFQSSDFLPFAAGIKAGAQSILVSHNIMSNIDADLPASLSPSVHDILRNDLQFNGVIMTDDLIMDAITEYTNGSDAAILAVEAGNDMLISSDFETQYQAVLESVHSGRISEDQIDACVRRIIIWKIKLNLIDSK